MPITKDILIEDLVEDYPFAEEFLRVRGVKCIRCGEPIWGTLEEACKEKGFSDEEIEKIVEEMNRLAENPPEEDVPDVPKIEEKKIDKPKDL